MASESRPATHPVMDALRERPHAFGFFQAVRRLESAHAQLPRVGCSPRLADDPIRFGQEASLAFAPSTVRRFVVREGHVPRMLVSFMGLLGPNGPLPLHVTEYARDRERNAGDAGLVRFLDLFHHRMVSLFYRAWLLNNQAASFDRPGDDRFSVYVASLLGLGMESLRDRDELPDLAKLFYSGAYSCQTRHADGLRSMLEGYLGIHAEIEELVGQWLELPADSRCIMGRDRRTGTLGSTAVVGARIWDCQRRFRVLLGPVTLEQYERLLPGGVSLDRIGAMVRNYIGDEFEWDLRLVLLASEVPDLHLGVQGRLGWSTWIRSRPFDQDAGDLVLRPRLN